MRPRIRARLTQRQQDCLDARRNRLTAKETGRRLDISPHTVAMHLRLARLKLDHTNDDLETAEPGARHAEPGARAFEWMGIVAGAVLAMGALLSALYVLAWLVLLFSPWFRHLRH